jgi:hypothetical protein
MLIIVIFLIYVFNFILDILKYFLLFFIFIVLNIKFYYLINFLNNIILKFNLLIFFNY